MTNYRPQNCSSCQYLQLFRIQIQLRRTAHSFEKSVLPAWIYFDQLASGCSKGRCQCECYRCLQQCPLPWFPSSGSPWSAKARDRCCPCCHSFARGPSRSRAGSRWGARYCCRCWRGWSWCPGRPWGCLAGCCGCRKTCGKGGSYFRPLTLLCRLDWRRCCLLLCSCGCFGRLAVSWGFLFGRILGRLGHRYCQNHRLFLGYGFVRLYWAYCFSKNHANCLMCS